MAGRFRPRQPRPWLRSRPNDKRHGDYRRTEPRAVPDAAGHSVAAGVRCAHPELGAQRMPCCTLSLFILLLPLPTAHEQAARIGSLNPFQRIQNVGVGDSTSFASELRAAVDFRPAAGSGTLPVPSDCVAPDRTLGSSPARAHRLSASSSLLAGSRCRAGRMLSLVPAIVQVALARAAWPPGGATWSRGTGQRHTGPFPPQRWPICAPSCPKHSDAVLFRRVSWPTQALGDA